jgi:hypothetical protein
MHAAIAATRDRELVTAALVGMGVTVPADLQVAPSRLGYSEHMCAAGFVDTHSDSVTVDIALWTAPPSPALDAEAWHAVFKWIVAGGAEIRCPRLHGSVTVSPSSVRADYVYEYAQGGQGGCGVLSITAVGSQAWQIVDCWGDATSIARILELSNTCRLPESAR